MMEERVSRWALCACGWAATCQEERRLLRLAVEHRMEGVEGCDHVVSLELRSGRTVRRVWNL